VPDACAQIAEEWCWHVAIACGSLARVHCFCLLCGGGRATCHWEVRAFWHVWMSASALYPEGRGRRVQPGLFFKGFLSPTTRTYRGLRQRAVKVYLLKWRLPDEILAIIASYTGCNMRGVEARHARERPGVYLIELASIAEERTALMLDPAWS
jgi:hypothetical protein